MINRGGDGGTRRWQGSWAEQGRACSRVDRQGQSSPNKKGQIQEAPGADASLLEKPVGAWELTDLSAGTRLYDGGHTWASWLGWLPQKTQLKLTFLIKEIYWDLL